MLVASSSPLLPGIIAVAAAIAGSVGTYLVARRQHSGKIDTTEAATLWAESQAMRRELRDETVALREEVKELRGKNDELTEKVVGLEAEHASMSSELEALRARLAQIEGHA